MHIITDKKAVKWNYKEIADSFILLIAVYTDKNKINNNINTLVVIKTSAL